MAIHDRPKRRDGTRPTIVQVLSTDKKNELMREETSWEEVTFPQRTLNSLEKQWKREKKLWTMQCKVHIKKGDADPKCQIKSLLTFRSADYGYTNTETLSNIHTDVFLFVEVTDDELLYR